jgi:hypothetical protein
VRRDVIDARSSLEPPPALLAELALQSPLGDAAGHLAVLSVIVAVFDERSRAVVLFGLLAAEDLDASHEVGLGLAEILELAAAMREPARARGLCSNSSINNLAVLPFGGGESPARRRIARVDRKRGLGARRELDGEARDRVGAVRVDGRVLEARRVGVTRGVELVGLSPATQRCVAQLAIQPGDR